MQIFGTRTPTSASSKLAGAAAIAILFGALFCSTFLAHADEADPELTKLKLEAEKAKAQAETAKAEADIAKAKRDALEATLPKSSTEGVEGKVELDKVSIGAHVQTYVALTKATAGIAKAIIDSGAKVVVVRSASDMNALLALKTVKIQVDFLKRQYDGAFLRGPSIAVVPPLLLPQAISSVLGSIGDIAGFFKTDTKITGVDVTLNNTAVVPELAKALRGKVTVYYPEVAPVSLLGDQSAGLIALIADLDKLRPLYEQARPIVDAVLKIKDLEAKLAAAKEGDKAKLELQLEEAKKDPNANDLRGPLLVLLNVSVDKLIAGLNQTDTAGISNMARLGNTADLRTVLQEPDVRLLEITAQKSGGNNKTTHKVFSSGKEVYSGGVIISYTLFNADSAIVLSGTESSYQAYARLDTTPKSGQP
jgi:hypothetical protein